MSLLDIRKIVVQLEEIQKEMNREVSPPSRKVTVAAVIKNPYAGQYVENLEPLYDLGAEIGGLLAERGVQALGVEPDAVEATDGASTTEYARTRSTEFGRDGKIQQRYS